MRRVLRLTQQFHHAARRVAPAGTTAAQALAATLARLTVGELPGPFDAPTLVPPSRRCWFRRVPHCNLWVFYTFGEDAVVIRHIVSSPPVPLDD